MLEFRDRKARHIPDCWGGTHRTMLARLLVMQQPATEVRCPVELVVATTVVVARALLVAAEAKAKTAMLVVMPGDKLLRAVVVVDTKVVEVVQTAAEAEGEVRLFPMN